MDDSHYIWHFEVRFGDGSGFDEMREVAQRLDAALVAAAERTLSEEAQGEITLQLRSGAAGAVERQITLRRAYQIAALPAALYKQRYASAAQAIEHLRSLRALGTAGWARGLSVLRLPDGLYCVGAQQPDACEFATRAEAEEALQSFAEPARFVVMAYIDIMTEREPDGEPE